MHAIAVKHGGRFVDTFLKGEEPWVDICTNMIITFWLLFLFNYVSLVAAFNFLETQFGQHNVVILQMVIGY